MAKTTSSEASGFLMILLLLFLALIFLSQSDTRSVFIDHLKYGDAKANEIHNSVGTCSKCKRKNQKLTDGECPVCFFEK